MTRGEEIKCASKDYINYLLDKQEYHNENYTEYDIQQAFEKGAQWAYNNPKSPWISVEKDLPCNHPELITGESSVYSEITIPVIAVIHNFIIMSRMYKEDGKWHWENDEPTHWMQLPKLPKEQDIKL